MKYLLSIIAAINFFNYAAEKNQQFRYVTLPGQNGLGCESYVDNKIVVENNSHSLETLSSWKIDLGQGNCIRDFERQLKEIPKSSSKLIFCGVSQATATITNYVAGLSIKEQENKIGALVLESILGHGVSAMMHTTEYCVSKKATYFPFSRFWIPVIGKLVFPTYNPFGMQTIKSAAKISPNIPVLIMHHHNDPQLSINDARQLYCVLKKNGNDKTYLLEINNNFRSHVNILDSYDFEEPELKKTKLKAVHAIYKKHNLPYHSYEDIDQFDLTPYTPSIQEVEKRIYDSTWKSRYLRNAIDITSSSLILGYLGYKYLR